MTVETLHRSKAILMVHVKACLLKASVGRLIQSVSGKNCANLKWLLLSTVTNWLYLVVERKASWTVRKTHCCSIANNIFAAAHILQSQFCCPRSEGPGCLCHGKRTEECWRIFVFLSTGEQNNK